VIENLNLINIHPYFRISYSTWSIEENLNYYGKKDKDKNKNIKNNSNN